MNSFWTARQQQEAAKHPCTQHAQNSSSGDHCLCWTVQMQACFCAQRICRLALQAHRQDSDPASPACTSSGFIGKSHIMLAKVRCRQINLVS